MVQTNPTFTEGLYKGSGNGRGLASNESINLISADKVEGTNVYNFGGEKLGSIDKIMIDKRTGHVAYAVMSFGGFLGIGNRYHPLPWGVLTYDEKQGGYTVNLDKKILEAAPMIEDYEDVDWNDRVWGLRVHDYYKTPPYWLD